MFILSTISDTLFIPGASFANTSDPSQPATSHHSIALAINTKYANKVIPDVGLCICLFDILQASEGRVKWGDGGLWHSVKARLVVFRPFVGEILVGKVMSSDEKGIRGTLCAWASRFCSPLADPVVLMQSQWASLMIFTSQRIYCRVQTPCELRARTAIAQHY